MKTNEIWHKPYYLKIMHSTELKDIANYIRKIKLVKKTNQKLRSIKRKAEKLIEA